MVSRVDFWQKYNEKKLYSDTDKMFPKLDQHFEVIKELFGRKQDKDMLFFLSERNKTFKSIFSDSLDKTGKLKKDKTSVEDFIKHSYRLLNKFKREQNKIRDLESAIKKSEFQDKKKNIKTQVMGLLKDDYAKKYFGRRFSGLLDIAIGDFSSLDNLLVGIDKDTKIRFRKNMPTLALILKYGGLVDQKIHVKMDGTVRKNKKELLHTGLNKLYDCITAMHTDKNTYDFKRKSYGAILKLLSKRKNYFKEDLFKKTLDRLSEMANMDGFMWEKSKLFRDLGDLRSLRRMILKDFDHISHFKDIPEHYNKQWISKTGFTELLRVRAEDYKTDIDKIKFGLDVALKYEKTYSQVDSDIEYKNILFSLLHPRVLKIARKDRDYEDITFDEIRSLLESNKSEKYFDAICDIERHYLENKNIRRAYMWNQFLGVEMGFEDYRSSVEKNYNVQKNNDDSSTEYIEEKIEPFSEIDELTNKKDYDIDRIEELEKNVRQYVEDNFGEPGDETCGDMVSRFLDYIVSGKRKVIRDRNIKYTSDLRRIQDKLGFYDKKPKP